MIKVQKKPTYYNDGLELQATRKSSYVTNDNEWIIYTLAIIYLRGFVDPPTYWDISITYVASHS